MNVSDAFDFNFIWNVFSNVIFHIIIFGTSVYYIIRRQNLEGFLLAGGSFIHICTSIIFSLIYPMMVRNSNISMQNTGIIFMIINGIAFIGSILFVIGLILLVGNHVALYKKMDK
jgi:hypothetical protein